MKHPLRDKFVTEHRVYKIVVIGSGRVGTTFAYTLLLSGLVGEIVLIDLDKDRTEGEVSLIMCPAAILSVFTRVDYVSARAAECGYYSVYSQTRRTTDFNGILTLQTLVPNYSNHTSGRILLVAPIG